MSQILLPALRLFLLLTVLTGIVYPFAVTGLAQLLFPVAAHGSLVLRDGKPVGSALLAQGFTGERYFWPRPSATGYNAAASSGSNLGPSNPALHDAVKERVAALRAAHPDQTGPVPVELVTTSASGLDPQLSPAAALYQAGRVASARGLDEAAVRALVTAHIEGRAFGVLGEPVVNVLQLNLALDALR